MTPEKLKAHEQAARREYPETKAAFDRVRAAAVANMFKTGPAETEKREELYRLVHILNQVEEELVFALGQGSDEIAKYIESLKPQATTGNR